MPKMADWVRRVGMRGVMLGLVLAAAPGMAWAQGGADSGAQGGMQGGAQGSGPANGQPADAVNSTVYYRAGNWEAFSGRATSGGTFCGISTYFPRDGRGFMIRHRTGSPEVIFRARKPGWAVPEGARVAVTVQVGPNNPFLTNATGQGEVLEWMMSRETMAEFDAQFRRGAVLTLAFPSGNEPAWAVPLTGSNAIGATFARCISELAAATPGGQTQPFTSSQAAPAPAPSGPTQPFTQPQQAAPSGGEAPKQ